jgi:hypothetical protein
LIEPDKLAFTTAAGGSAGIVAVLALGTAVVDWLGGVDVTDNIKIALIGLAGAGFLAWAIASGAVVLARAYAASHVAHVVTKDTATDTAPKPALPAAAPALQVAAEKLAGTLVPAVPPTPATPGPSNPGGAASAPALPGPSNPGGGLPPLVALPAELDILVGRSLARAIAGRLEADGKMSYLVTQKDTRPRWVGEAEVTTI